MAKYEGGNATRPRNRRSRKPGSATTADGGARTSPAPARPGSASALGAPLPDMIRLTQASPPRVRLYAAAEIARSARPVRKQRHRPPGTERGARFRAQIQEQFREPAGVKVRSGLELRLDQHLHPSGRATAGARPQSSGTVCLGLGHAATGARRRHCASLASSRTNPGRPERAGKTGCPFASATARLPQDVRWAAGNPTALSPALHGVAPVAPSRQPGPLARTGPAMRCWTGHPPLRSVPWPPVQLSRTLAGTPRAGGPDRRRRHRLAPVRRADGARPRPARAGPSGRPARDRLRSRPGDGGQPRPAGVLARRRRPAQGRDPGAARQPGAGPGLGGGAAAPFGSPPIPCEPTT